MEEIVKKEAAVAMLLPSEATSAGKEKVPGTNTARMNLVARHLVRRHGGSADIATDWRTRDPVVDLLRTASGPTRLRSGQAAGTTESAEATVVPPIQPIYSNKFDVMEAIERVVSDPQKLEGAKAAFDAAALSVLRALLHKSPPPQSEVPTTALQHVPPFIQALQELGTLREECWELASSVRKRTGTTVSASKRGSTIASFLLTTSPTSEEPKKKKAKTIMSVSSATPTTATKIATKTESSPTIKTEEVAVKKEKKVTSVSSCSSPTPLPAFSSSQMPPPAANIDPRATVSRAILCSAISVAISELTPDFPEHGPIDVLDVPQNTLRNKAGDTSQVFSTLDIVEDDKNSGGETLNTLEEGTKEGDKSKLVVNMGAVLLQSKTLGLRAAEQAINAAGRSQRRHEYRTDNALAKLQLSHKSSGNNGNTVLSCSIPLTISNPFKISSKKAPTSLDLVVKPSDWSSLSLAKKSPPLRINSTTAHDTEWTDRCLPRLRSVLDTGAGHAILHDQMWSTRAARIASLLKDMTKPSAGQRPNYGPHLIVTTEQDFPAFASEFEAAGKSVNLLLPALPSMDQVRGNVGEATSAPLDILRALEYRGSVRDRKRLRRTFFQSSTAVPIPSGLVTSPYHVVLTTYKAFLEDYSHLCQIPYQVALLDDGMAWMGLSSLDPNGYLGRIWEAGGIWSASDKHIGMAGTSEKPWDFDVKENDDDMDRKPGLAASSGSDTEDDEPSIKEEDIKKEKKKKKKKGAIQKKDRDGNCPCVGLTARHRLLTASSMHARHRDTLYAAPVPSLLSFLMPHYAEVTREEWDRSRINTDPESMDHVRTLIGRSVIVYTGVPQQASSLHRLALDAMNGVQSDAFMQNEDTDLADEVVTEEQFVISGKIIHSRRLALSWFPESCSIRSELGQASLAPVLNSMSESNSHGYVCEEVVTASSTTSSGAGGAITGTQAYRLAIRCGRYFGSEQGLRQHVAALHAPPGTWLCRTCGGDCGTSQARTHHERYCGTNGVTPGGGGPTVGGGSSTVGQGVGSSQGAQKHGAVGNKTKQSGGPAGLPAPEDKDDDGSFRVPGYRGVWVNPAGKHFIKIEGVPLTKDEGGGDGTSASAILFDTIEETAKRYDEIVNERGNAAATELNFRGDGTRILYEDSSSAAGRGLEMLGGGTSSVVPALSVINIKDLPKNVKPLLRDPKQTSRTGGNNSKRYVYAYRGVCRQARKGHDRWQSQISFGGTNHYLGTFDSEWDAAAIYAWAHLILYGEEATQKAQKEGEDAAAAYEQEKKDIASGKIIIPPPKPAKLKKKKGPAKKNTEEKKEGEKTKKKPKEKKEEKAQSKPKAIKPDDPKATSESGEKLNKGTKLLKKRPVPTGALTKAPSKSSKNGEPNKVSSVPTVVPFVARSPILAPRRAHGDKSDKQIIVHSSIRLTALRVLRCTAPPAVRPNLVDGFATCIPATPSHTPLGCAMLMGLSADDFDWDIRAFIDSITTPSIPESVTTALENEYETGGFNERFKTVIQGSLCVLGRVSVDLEKASKLLGLGTIPLGGTAADVDCNIGGTVGSCSEAAARIQYTPTSVCDFQISALNDSDIVTLNGERIQSNMGTFPLLGDDICTVGSRVFVFLLPK